MSTETGELQFIETLKVELIWTRDWESEDELRLAIEAWLVGYNHRRPHQALGWLTPAEKYISRICGMEMPPHLITNPVNGFAHKAGIHLDAIVRFGPHKYELLSPGVVGNKRNMITGTVLSGKTDEEDVRNLDQRLAWSER